MPALCQRQSDCLLYVISKLYRIAQRPCADSKTVLGRLTVPFPVPVMGLDGYSDQLGIKRRLLRASDSAIRKKTCAEFGTCVQACLSAAGSSLGFARTLLLLRIAEVNPDDRRLNPY